jgi:hypothetical protein
MFKIKERLLMKKVFILLLLFPTIALAENSNSSLNLQLPNAGTSYGQDAFRSGEMDCKNSIGGGTNFEFGMTGIIDNYQSPFDQNAGDTSKDVGVYARITIPLDAPKERINCNTLYQLELKRKRLEILKLEQELLRLQQLQEGSD